ncbi:hypothetical protein COCMIDRAFT_23744 [Bipolaris oryzae ATCC 44560]|uniref:Uncharacterized protein n=1 Tax=Bipolaris oryzae ATCC 44560 TaxID=930090 RepID=W6ZF94_COCMI|nr:uncharacterized protein COCMIDRAFT_23744 [Bipolaris oryzae ATCC 44560]EUC48578.1 hypothetical protein COCMIDRAFT_23744 [Bipolaris oryzae ATCC 44560]
MDNPTPTPRLKRPSVQDEDEVRKSQRRRLSSGDSLIETLLRVQKLISSQMAESPGSNADNSKNNRRRRGEERSKVSIKSNSPSVSRRQPYGRQRPRPKLRQIVPAASAPNSSVFENQQQEYELQAMLNSRSKRITGRMDVALTLLPQIPFPYGAGQQSSYYHPSYTSPMDAERRHSYHRYGASYGNIPTGSGDSSLLQARGVAGFISAPAYPPASLSQPIPAAGTYHQWNTYDNLITGQRGQPQGPGSLAGFPPPEGPDPRLMGPPQYYQSAVTNGYPAMPSTGLSMRSAGPSDGVSPGSYYSQHQPLPTQFGMATAPGMSIRPPHQPMAYSAVPVNDPPGNYSGFAPPRSSQTNFRTGLQAQTQFASPGPGQSDPSLQTQTSPMGFPPHLGIPAQYSSYVNLPLPYPPPMSNNAGPSETRAAPIPTRSIPNTLPLPSSPKVPVAEASAQLLEEPSQQNAQDSTSFNILNWDPTSPYLMGPEEIEQIRRLCLAGATGENGNEGLDESGLP